MTKAARKAGPDKKRIFLRMTLLSWAVLVIALGAFILAGIPYQRRVFVEQLESQGESLASSVSQVVNSSVVMSDYSGIVNHCSEVIEKNPSIRYVIVARKDGFALVHTYNGWRQEQLNGEVWLPKTAHPLTIPFYSNPLIDEEVFQYSRPLDYSGLTWGWIHIGLSLDKLKRDLRVLYGRTVGLSLVCAAVGFVLSFAFAKRMTQPIIALHNATVRVRNGDLTTRAEVKTGDEIESLALSFNEMAETLQRSQSQLSSTNEHLRAEVVERKQAEAELKAAQEKLIETAHRAGMAEVAADILHNVGNVLNSINVSTTAIREKVTNSELAGLEKVAGIINEHTDDLGTFLTEHPQGKHIPVYLTEVSKCLQDEQTDIISRLKVLADNVQHIKDIISMQQSYAKVSGVEVQTSLSKLVEDAIQINSAGLERHGTRLIREFEELGDVEIDKQKMLQILVNLISNAKYALSGSKREEKLLTIRIYKHNEARFRIEVADNGVGISKDNLTKIFSHGFTTKERGHGFGLHSCALASKEMGGSLTVYSDGVGRGATFTLELPFKPIRILKERTR